MRNLAKFKLKFNFQIVIFAVMGHDHGPKIPSYTFYDNYREIPKLRAHEERLARIGLKDPWIRYVLLLELIYPICHIF